MDSIDLVDAKAVGRSGRSIALNAGQGGTCDLTIAGNVKTTLSARDSLSSCHLSSFFCVRLCIAQHAVRNP